MGSDKFKIILTVADGEVLVWAWPGPAGGRGTPCLLLINWVANYYTHRGLGSELLPAPVFSPLNAPFWGRGPELF
jgi:hypothetical protein